jgi:hypothetical protein
VFCDSVLLFKIKGHEEQSCVIQGYNPLFLFPYSEMPGVVDVPWD